MDNIKFPAGFILGAATSSYQIEGGWNKDGKGLSIWDTFSHQPGRVADDENGDIACNHYQKYKEDVSLMKKLNLMGYRFSISWPRIFPKGLGAVNESGAQFYDNLINELLEAGIEPCITLYHWDLPQSLSDDGGWTNRSSIDAFTNYAEYCFKRYGDRVKKWVTFNEAYIVAHLGYNTGKFAPGIKNPAAATQVSHHINLAHARAVEVFRKLKVNGEIGIVHCISPVHNMLGTLKGDNKATIIDGLWNRWHTDPSLKGCYPEDIMALREKYGTAPKVQPGDMDLLKSNICDFLGINYYFRFRVYDEDYNDPSQWMSGVNTIPVPGAFFTEMGWEVYPAGLFEILERVASDYGNIPLYVTENGMAAADKIELDGQIEDEDRLSYLKSHLVMCKKAIDAGINLKGFYYWSLMDNFEWTSGYSKRFGLIRVDYSTQERTIKKSGKWYSQLIKNQLQQNCCVPN